MKKTSIFALFMCGLSSFVTIKSSELIRPIARRPHAQGQTAGLNTACNVDSSYQVAPINNAQLLKVINAADTNKAIGKGLYPDAHVDFWLSARMLPCIKNCHAVFSKAAQDPITQEYILDEILKDDDFFTKQAQGILATSIDQQDHDKKKKAIIFEVSKVIKTFDKEIAQGKCCSAPRRLVLVSAVHTMSDKTSVYNSKLSDQQLADLKRTSNRYFS